MARASTSANGTIDSWNQCTNGVQTECYATDNFWRSISNLTINVAVMSYCGELYFGIVGDGDAAPDLETLAGGIEDAFAELYALAVG